jgi:hypothetical protein
MPLACISSSVGQRRVCFSLPCANFPIRCMSKAVTLASDRPHAPQTHRTFVFVIVCLRHPASLGLCRACFRLNAHLPKNDGAPVEVVPKH